MDTAEVVRLVRLRIRGHQRKIYCRAIMWEMISAVVTAESAESVLNALPADERRYLHEQYDEWPPSLWSCRPPEAHAICAAVERWCLQTGASE